MAQVVGVIKGKIAVHLARVYGERRRNFVGQHFGRVGIIGHRGQPRTDTGHTRGCPASQPQPNGGDTLDDRGKLQGTATAAWMVVAWSYPDRRNPADTGWSATRPSTRYSLAVVRRLVEVIDPDYWLTEISPSRLARATEEFARTGAVAEPRVSRFPGDHLDPIGTHRLTTVRIEDDSGS